MAERVQSVVQLGTEVGVDWMGTHHADGTYLYDEWDCRRRHYGKDWCVPWELSVPPRGNEFVTRTLHKYARFAGDMRKSFEALRGEDKLLKKQK